MNFPKWARYGLIVILISSFIFYIYSTNSSDDHLEMFLDEYKMFDYEVKINNHPITYETYLEDEFIGYLVITEEVGYQSLIQMATLVNPKGYILDVRVFEEDETPGFFKRLTDNYFFNRFAGKSIENGFEIDDNIDAISRATISSRAVTQAVHEAAEHVGETIHVPVKTRYNEIEFGLTELAVLLLLLATVIAFKTKNKIMRQIVLFYSVIIIGFKYSIFISYSLLFSFMSGNLPAVSTALNRFLLVFGVLGLLLITGKNVYCTYMCPFGAIQELAFKNAKLPTFKVHRQYLSLFKMLPAVLAYTAFILVALTGKTGALNYEPFSLVFGFIGLDILWVLLPVIVITSFFIMRYYCIVGCPIGFILNSIVKIRNKVVKKCLKK